jgi:hypothetical protein
MVAGPEGVVAQRILRAVLTLPPPLNGHSSAADRDRPSGAQAPGRDRGDPSEPQGAPIPYRRCPRAPRIAFLRAALKSGASRARAVDQALSTGERGLRRRQDIRKASDGAACPAKAAEIKWRSHLAGPRGARITDQASTPVSCARNLRRDGQGRQRHLGFHDR